MYKSSVDCMGVKIVVNPDFSKYQHIKWVDSKICWYLILDISKGMELVMWKDFLSKCSNIELGNSVRHLLLIPIQRGNVRSVLDELDKDITMIL